MITSIIFFSKKIFGQKFWKKHFWHKFFKIWKKKKIEKKNFLKNVFKKKKKCTLLVVVKALFKEPPLNGRFGNLCRSWEMSLKVFNQTRRMSTWGAIRNQTSIALWGSKFDKNPPPAGGANFYRTLTPKLGGLVSGVRETKPYGALTRQLNPTLKPLLHDHYSWINFGDIFKNWERIHKDPQR